MSHPTHTPHADSGAPTCGVPASTDAEMEDFFASFPTLREIRLRADAAAAQE